MASPAPIPAPACDVKLRLLEEFTKAVRNLNRIHSARLRAVMNGDSFRFEEEFAEALERREKAKYAVLAHQMAHGC